MIRIAAKAYGHGGKTWQSSQRVHEPGKLGNLKGCEHPGRWISYRNGKEKNLSFAGQADGVFRALSKIWQLFRFEEPGNTLPCLKITDQPVLRRRGFMLDISRCKVPTMEELFRLVDLLALLGYNELQLYIEHTFKFKDHDTVWKECNSPIACRDSGD